MKFGFIRTAAATPLIKVADCKYNTENIISSINQAYKNNAELIVFPELCITGYTCGDLFSQRRLVSSAVESIEKIKAAIKDKNIIVVLGFPFEYLGNLYNCAAVLYNGMTLAIIPKSYLPNYNEFYEMRWFKEALKDTKLIDFLGEEVPFGTNVIIQSESMPEFALGVEICEDLWSVIPPSLNHSLAGATVIANPSAGNEITGKDIYRKSLVESQSARIIGGYIYACAGEGESTTDVVYSGHKDRKSVV